MKKFIGIIVNRMEGSTVLKSVQATHEMEARVKFENFVSETDGDHLSDVYEDQTGESSK